MLTSTARPQFFIWSRQPNALNIFRTPSVRPSASTPTGRPKRQIRGPW